ARPPLHQERDDRAEIGPSVEDADAVDLRETVTQATAQRRRPRRDRIDADGQRVPGRRRGAEDVRGRALPVLEARSRLDRRIALELDPVRAAHVDEERLVTGTERAVRHEQEAASARPAQELPARRRQEVAADLTGVDAVLPDGLAGIDEVGEIEAPAVAADLRDRLDEPRVRRHVRDGDEPGSTLLHRL